MTIIVITYKGANQHSVSAGPGDRIVLNPGQNKVDEATWGRIVQASEKEKKANKGRATGVCRLIDDKLVKVLGEGDDESELFENLNQKDAIELISLEASIDKLDELYVIENDGKNRPKVLEAIEKQTEVLKEADNKDK